MFGKNFVWVAKVPVKMTSGILEDEWCWDCWLTLSWLSQDQKSQEANHSTKLNKLKVITIKTRPYFRKPSKNKYFQTNQIYWCWADSPSALPWLKIFPWNPRPFSLRWTFFLFVKNKPEYQFSCKLQQSH